MKGRRVRLFLRLTTGCDRLRMLMRDHRELSRYIDDALTSLDLTSIELTPMTLGRSARGITAIVSGSASTQCSRQVARRKACLTKPL